MNGMTGRKAKYVSSKNHLHKNKISVGKLSGGI